MNVTEVYTDGKASSTGPLMHQMVDIYYRDMIPYCNYTLPEIFKLICSIPYREDPEFIETLQRPNLTMQMAGYGGDCDDKCICLASWAKLMMRPDPISGRPYRFLAVRRADKNILHHVVCELYLPEYREGWIHADPTYRFNTLGREREEYVERLIL